eukprot:6846637-Prymnesium_polylepis.1
MCCAGRGSQGGRGSTGHAHVRSSLTPLVLEESLGACEDWKCEAKALTAHCARAGCHRCPCPHPARPEAGIRPTADAAVGATCAASGAHPHPRSQRQSWQALHRMRAFRSRPAASTSI